MENYNVILIGIIRNTVKCYDEIGHETDATDKRGFICCSARTFNYLNDCTSITFTKKLV